MEELKKIEEEDSKFFTEWVQPLEVCPYCKFEFMTWWYLEEEEFWYCPKCGKKHLRKN